MVGAPTSSIRQGDVLRVLPGERVPVDGEILDGRCSLDESMLTGESALVNKAEGSQASPTFKSRTLPVTADSGALAGIRCSAAPQSYTGMDVAQLPEAQLWKRTNTDAPTRAGTAARQEQKSSVTLLNARPCLKWLACCSLKSTQHTGDSGQRYSKSPREWY